MVRVQVRFAEAGEVFTGSYHACTAQTCEKLPRVENHLFRIGGDRPLTHDRTRCRKCQVHHRSKISIESKRTAALADEAPMLAEKLLVAGGKYRGR